MDEAILLHTKEGNKTYKKSDLIQNGKDQEAKGVKPMYSTVDVSGSPGWLVFSTWEDGADVVFKREDGKYILIRGWQGEFAYG